MCVCVCTRTVRTVCISSELAGRLCSSCCGLAARRRIAAPDLRSTKARERRDRVLVGWLVVGGPYIGWPLSPPGDAERRALVVPARQERPRPHGGFMSIQLGLGGGRCTACFLKGSTCGLRTGSTCWGSPSWEPQPPRPENSRPGSAPSQQQTKGSFTKEARWQVAGGRVWGMLCRTVALRVHTDRPRV